MKTGKRVMELILGGMLLLLLLLGMAPERVEAAPNITAITAGQGHTCALTSGGTVWCWGQNWDGQLGTGQSGNISPTPVRVKDLSGVRAISGSGGHTCALTNENKVWCWGMNWYGQLGNGQSGQGKFSATPVHVLNLSGVTAIDAGGDHTCALKEGAVWCWGMNWYGQLGNGESGTGKLSATPVRVKDLSGVKAISAGLQHTCALKDGAVRCWGDNWNGQLGNGQSRNFSATPVRVKDLSGVKGTSAGDRHTCALKEGVVWCWGLNWYGQLGNGQSGEGKLSTTRVRVQNLSGVTDISAGYEYTCALTSARRVWCWGDNEYGQLGIGQSGEGKLTATPVPVQNLGGVAAISGGGGHTCALTSAGRVWCWGRNIEGQLGNGQSNNLSAIPVAVVWPTTSQ